MALRALPLFRSQLRAIVSLSRLKGYDRGPPVRLFGSSPRRHERDFDEVLRLARLQSGLRSIISELSSLGEASEAALDACKRCADVEEIYTVLRSASGAGPADPQERLNAALVKVAHAEFSLRQVERALGRLFDD